MKRKDFLKKIGIGVVAAGTIPSVLAETPIVKPETPETPITPVEIDVTRIPVNMTIEEVVKTYEETGVLCYNSPPPELRQYDIVFHKQEDRLYWVAELNSNDILLYPLKKGSDIQLPRSKYNELIIIARQNELVNL